MKKHIPQHNFELFLWLAVFITIGIFIIYYA